jgi:DivIVA domain-containing protein
LTKAEPTSYSRLSSQDLWDAEFDLALTGFDEREVDEFLTLADGEAESHNAEDDWSS